VYFTDVGTNNLVGGMIPFSVRIIQHRS